MVSRSTKRKSGHQRERSPEKEKQGGDRVSDLALRHRIAQSSGVGDHDVCQRCQVTLKVFVEAVLGADGLIESGKPQEEELAT
jgi:hypothetical protein